MCSGGCGDGGGCLQSAGLAAGSWKIGAHVAYVDGETGVWDLHDVEMVNEIDGITVVSKRARYDRNTKSVEFVDSVRVTQSGTVVNAESGFFSTETNTGTFRGSVSLVRTKTEEEAFDMELTCEELDLDASADSFIAKKDAVLRYVDEDGEETVLWADLMDYDGERRILKLTNVVKASSPSLPEGSQVASQDLEFKHRDRQYALHRPRPRAAAIRRELRQSPEVRHT